MSVNIRFYPGVARMGVILHAWEPTGGVWDITGTLDPAGFFSISLDLGPTVQPSHVLFKYRFYNPAIEWEADDFIRRIPSGGPQALWTFDFTAQCYSQDPFVVGSAVGVDFHVFTNRYAGGQLFAWVPGGAAITASQSSRDNHLDVSVFHLDVPAALSNRFYFKLIKPDGTYEADSCNRLWLPINGAQPR